MHRRLAFIAGLLLATAVVKPARATDTDGVATCSLDAISSDRDPNGLNIRAAPGTDAAVIGRIPPPRTIESEEFAGEVSITGSKDGWFRISHARMPDYINDDDKDVFDGEGWVSGRYLYVWPEEQYLRSGASTAKPIVADLFKPGPNGDPGGEDGFQIDRLDGCLGNWVEAEGTFMGTHVRGWTYGTCASQVTTCGGGHIPDPP